MSTKQLLPFPNIRIIFTMCPESYGLPEIFCYNKMSKKSKNNLGYRFYSDRLQVCHSEERSDVGISWYCVSIATFYREIAAP